LARWPALQSGEFSPEIQARKKINLTHLRQLRDMLPQAKQVGGEVWEYGQTATFNGNTGHDARIGGGTPEFFTLNNLPIASGLGYTEAEASDAGRVAVIGAA